MQIFGDMTEEDIEKYWEDIAKNLDMEIYMNESLGLVLLKVLLKLSEQVNK